MEHTIVTRILIFFKRKICDRVSRLLQDVENEYDNKLGFEANIKEKKGGTGPTKK